MDYISTGKRRKLLKDYSDLFPRTVSDEFIIRLTPTAEEDPTGDKFAIAIKVLEIYLYLLNTSPKEVNDWCQLVKVLKSIHDSNLLDFPISDLEFMKETNCKEEG